MLIADSAYAGVNVSLAVPIGAVSKNSIDIELVEGREVWLRVTKMSIMTSSSNKCVAMRGR